MLLAFEASLSLGEAMAAQGEPKRKKLAADEKIKIKSKTASTPAKFKEKALRSAQAKAKHERQARVKAEKDLIEAQKELVAARLDVEQERHAKLKRVSFVVRLTVGQHGQLGRTEIEHVESNKKHNFLSLDGERLVAFMKACVSPTIIPEPSLPPTFPPEKIEATTPETPKPKCSLVVSDIRVFRQGDPDFMTLILMHEESFIVQAGFHLQGREARFLTAQEPSYEMKVYANEITSSKSKLLTTYCAGLTQGVLQYSVLAEMPRLLPGFYRLFTLVTLIKPLKIAGYYDGPVIQVI